MYCRMPVFAETPQVAEVERVIDIFFRNTFTAKEENVNAEMNIYLGNPQYKVLSFQEQHRCALLKILMEVYKRYASDNCNLKIPRSFKQRSNEYLEESCESFQWIESIYKKSDNQNDIIKISDIYTEFEKSDYKCQLSRAKQRELTKKEFTKQIAGMVFLKPHYCYRKNIDGVDIYNILCGYKEKDEDDEED